MGAFLAANWFAILLGCGLAGVAAYVVKLKNEPKPAPDGTATDGAPKAAVSPAIVAKFGTLKADLETTLKGLGIVQDVGLLKGDFDASAALFFNRALSHGVAKIVRAEDQAAAAKLYADAAQLIAASSAAPTVPTT